MRWSPARAAAADSVAGSDSSLYGLEVRIILFDLKKRQTATGYNRAGTATEVVAGVRPETALSLRGVWAHRVRVGGCKRECPGSGTEVGYEHTSRSQFSDCGVRLLSRHFGVRPDIVDRRRTISRPHRSRRIRPVPRHIRSVGKVRCDRAIRSRRRLRVRP